MNEKMFELICYLDNYPLSLLIPIIISISFLFSLLLLFHFSFILISISILFLFSFLFHSSFHFYFIPLFISLLYLFPFSGDVGKTSSTLKADIEYFVIFLTAFALIQGFLVFIIGTVVRGIPPVQGKQ